mmetsp:Transcript_29285/g.44691  ORF Transcript_29285/g.44691 Transcript_29285/m.44691 type:complete len:326 (-) Transcript_29285:50-1027(-)
MNVVISMLASFFASSVFSHIAQQSRTPAVQPLSTKSSRSSTAAALLMAATATMSTSACQHSGLPDELIELDNYSGVILRIQNIKDNTLENEFRERLSASLLAWREEGKRGIWIHVPTDSAHLVPVCTDLGFDFHSAQSGKVILTQWLDTSTSSRLPLGPTHQVGIGCLVMNSDQKMLVVKEKTGPAAKYDLWKLPTGLLDPGEDIPTAAKRELKEETGLNGELHKILCSRHAPGHDGRVSDLFFICLMKLPEHPQTLVKCEHEIADIQWMEVSDYCSQDTWTRSPIYDELHQAMITAIEQGGMEARAMELGYRPGIHTIYVPPKL